MSHDCVDPRLLGDLLELDHEDPRRREIERCPRCRVLLREYERFLAGPRERDARLMKFLEQAPKRAARSRPRWQVPALAAAAALILAIGLSQWDFSRPPGPSLERGEGIVEGFAATATVEPDSVQFEWDSVDGADNYTVVIFSEDLSERSRLSAGEGALRLRVAAAEVAGSGDTVAWQVLALAHADEIQRSAMGFLTVP